MQLKPGFIFFIIAPIFIPLLIQSVLPKSESGLTQPAGYIYQQYHYAHYGYRAIATQDQQSETVLSSYTGAIVFNHIHTKQPYRLTLIAPTGAILVANTTIRTGYFEIRRPATPHYFSFIIIILGLIMTVFFLILFLIILAKEKKTRLGLPFSIAILSPFFYYLTSFIQIVLANLGHELLAGRIFALHRLGYLFLAPALFHFCYNLTAREKTAPKFIFWTYLPALTSIIVLLSWIPLGSDHNFQHYWGFTFDRFNQILGIYLLFFLMAALRQLGIKHSRTYPLRKYRNILVGITSAITLLMVLLVIPQLFLQPEYFPGYYDLSILLIQGILFGTLTYGILNRHLLDVNLILSKTVLYIIFSLSFAALYIVCTHTLVSQFHPDNPAFSSSVILVLLFGLLEPIRLLLQKYFDLALFPEENLSQPALNFINTHIATSLNKQQIVEQTLYMFKMILKIHRTIVMDYDPERHLLISCQHHTPIKFAYTASCPTLLSWITRLEETHPHAADNLLPLLDITHTEALFPLVLNDELFGIIACKRKKDFNRSDIKLITEICISISIALKNSATYEKLIQAERQSLKSEKLASIGKLATAIAHEIKNPLSAIIPLVNVIPQMHQDSTFRDDFMDIVPRQLTRIDQKVRSMLHFSRPETGSRNPLLIHTIIEETLQLYHHQLTRQHITLDLTLDKSLTLYANREAMVSILNNLLLNAIEACHSQGQIMIQTTQIDQTLQLSIADSGIGIAASELGKIFEPFYTTKPEGSGIGLATVHQLVQDLGGKIRVSSRPNEGTEFILEFPLAKA